MYQQNNKDKEPEYYDQTGNSGYYPDNILHQPVPQRNNTSHFVDQSSQYYQPQPNDPYQANNNQNFQNFPSNSSFPDFQNSMTAQMGVHLGQKAVEESSKYLGQTVGQVVDMQKLKHYFNVTNLYVLQKLTLLLFPFKHKTWARQVDQDGGDAGITYQPPRYDVNAPDLYIPVTALVTYILVVGFLAGDKFKPDLLGRTATSALAVVFFEVILLKLGCYLFSVSSPSQILDLIAYCGYKFVGIILTNLAKRTLPDAFNWLYWVVFIYTCVATGFFLLRSLRHIVLPETAMGVANPFRKRRVNLLFGIAAIQLISCYVLIS